MAVAVLATAIFAASLGLSGPASTTRQGVASSTLVQYGDAPSAFGQLWMPEGVSAPPTVVLFHGGFWRRDGGDLQLMEPLAEHLVESGYAVWNVEYGRSGEKFGGWPFTFDHVVSAITVVDELADDYDLDASRVVLVGHSAGGHLALWAAGQESVDGVVALAPIVDLDRAFEDGLGNGAVSDLLGGGPDDFPERYDAAAISRLPETPVLIITGSSDDSVPPEFTEGLSGAAVKRVVFESVDHLGLIRGNGDVADAVVDAVEEFSADRE